MAHRGDSELALIVACADNGVIGRDNRLPWRLPEDLRHFRRLTLGHPVLMGRKTYESLGKPLEGRDNWVLTRTADYAAAPGVRVFQNLAVALAAAEAQQGPVYVIGGAELYRQTLPYAQRLELTQVHADVAGDTHFPDWDRQQWRVLAQEPHAADERHAHAYTFLSLRRV